MASDSNNFVGVVVYTITSSHTIDAAWYSSNLDSQHLGMGRAVGDTTDGFPGDYRIDYRTADGADLGSYDLEITYIGQVYQLTWRQGGEIKFYGFGILDKGALSAGWTKH